MGVETERPQKRIEDLIGTSPLSVRANKKYLRQLYRRYKRYLKPIEEVREVLTRELDEDETLSKGIVELRRGETH